MESFLNYYVFTIHFVLFGSRERRLELDKGASLFTHLFTSLTFLKEKKKYHQHSSSAFHIFSLQKKSYVNAQGNLSLNFPCRDYEGSWERKAGFDQCPQNYNVTNLKACRIQDWSLGTVEEIHD